MKSVNFRNFKIFNDINSLILSKRNFKIDYRYILTKQNAKINEEKYLLNNSNELKTELKKLTNLDAKIDKKHSETTDVTDKNDGITLPDNLRNKYPLKLKDLLKDYSELSKRNLTCLVVCTTVSGYVMAYSTFDPWLLFYTSLGTALTSSAANAINQFLEVPYDSQMIRTKDRVLVRGNLTPLHGFLFGVVTLTSGLGVLLFLVNPITAILGAMNFALYTSFYTPMKRISFYNTWIGSLVGAIPPIMGLTACTGRIDACALLMGGILYSWQFPHFHALSWNLRHDYTKAGYRMAAATNPRVCTQSSLNHTIGLLLMCSCLAPALDLTTLPFAIITLPVNISFIYLARKFKKNQDASSSRQLFKYSLYYLPVIIILLFCYKKPVSERFDYLSELLKTDLTWFDFPAIFNL